MPPVPVSNPPPSDPSLITRLRRWSGPLLIALATAGLWAAHALPAAPPVRPADAPAPVATPAPDLTTRAGIQAALDALDTGRSAIPAAELRLPPGLVDLDRPLWLDRPGVRLVGHHGTRLRAKNAFPAVITGLHRPTADWLASHTVPLDGGGFGWDTAGDSYLSLRCSPFDLGDWSGPSVQASRLRGWAAVRTLTVTISLIRDDPDGWHTQQNLVSTIGRGNGQLPDPWRLQCSDDGLLSFEVATAEGPVILATWRAPAETRLDLTVTLDLDVGTVSVVQNDAPVTFTKYQVYRGLHLLNAEAAEVAIGQAQQFRSGRFVLKSFRMEADGNLLGRIDPLPAVPPDGLWRWEGRAGLWGYGLLRPNVHRDTDTIGYTGIERCEVGVMDGLPYGCGVLLGLALDFRARDVTFSLGARGLDQMPGHIAYTTRIQDCRFTGQHHCCLNLDAGIATVRDTDFQGYTPQYFVRSRSTTLTIDGCFFAESGGGLESAVRLAEMGPTVLRGLVFDLETMPWAPPHLVDAELGKDNGGVSSLRIDDTPAAACTVTPLRLSNPWSGMGGGVGPGVVLVRNSFRTNAPTGLAGLSRIVGGSWTVQADGPGLADGLPVVAPSPPVVGPMPKPEPMPPAPVVPGPVPAPVTPEGE